jgi:hypothetical protein
LVDVLNPRKLNEAFYFADKNEMSFQGQQRKYKGVSKQQPLIIYPTYKKKFIKDKEVYYIN